MISGKIRFDQTFPTQAEAIQHEKTVRPPGRFVLIELNGHWALATTRDLIEMRRMIEGQTHRTEVKGQLGEGYDDQDA